MPSVDTPTHEPTEKEGSKAVQVILGVIALATFGVWGYVYSGKADRESPDILDDPSFAMAGEQICAEAMAAFDQLPNALDAATATERARDIHASNELLSSMIDDLEAEVTGTARDVDISTKWLDDWRTYIANRDDFATRLETDERAVFYVSGFEGERLDKRIPRFANENKMFSCVTPGDIG